ncbi:MAG: rhodanese-like domain-containing protein [Cystobacterineae bacterium]|nr:rhodanese-like domain-containing protein [Cystobacterineae bacterium]
MKKVLLWKWFILSLAASLGCSKVLSNGTETEDVGVAKMDAWLKAGEVTPVDVNVEEVRREYGVLPGAVFLEFSSNYELALLPKDKLRRLVFYCLDKRCTASHVAARRARNFGHKEVYIMSGGIKAWKEAGLETLLPPTL